MSIAALFDPRSVLITGIATDPVEPEMLRVYVGHRSDWNFVLASGDEADKVRREWGSARHLVTVLPADAVVYHDAEGKARARAEFMAEHPWPGESGVTPT